MKTFLKGIIVGIGGVSPGLSGSVLLIIFGLYQKTLDALGNFFKDLKKNAGIIAKLVKKNPKLLKVGLQKLILF